MTREDCDTKIRTILNRATIEGMTSVEIVFLLTRMLPELSERSNAFGQLTAAFDLHEARHGRNG